LTGEEENGDKERLLFRKHYLCDGYWKRKQESYHHSSYRTMVVARWREGGRKVLRNRMLTEEYYYAEKSEKRGRS
jgi:hypothetical protein